MIKEIKQLVKTKSFLFFVIGVLLVAIMIAVFLIGRATVDTQANISHSATAGEIKELPTFEMVSWITSGVNWGEITKEGAPMLFGLFTRGDTTMHYRYSWHVLLGADPIPARLVDDIVVLNEADIEIRIVGEITVKNFKEIVTVSENWTSQDFSNQEVLDLTDTAIDAVTEILKVDEEGRFQLAKSNLMAQLEAMYTALGHEVEWR